MHVGARAPQSCSLPMGPPRLPHDPVQRECSALERGIGSCSLSYNPLVYFSLFYLVKNFRFAHQPSAGLGCLAFVPIPTEMVFSD